MNADQADEEMVSLRRNSKDAKSYPSTLRRSRVRAERPQAGLRSSVMAWPSANDPIAKIRRAICYKINILMLNSANFTRSGDLC